MTKKIQQYALELSQASLLLEPHKERRHKKTEIECLADTALPAPKRFHMVAQYQLRVRKNRTRLNNAPQDNLALSRKLPKATIRR